MLVGLNGTSLIAMGETKSLALYTLASAILNIFLIPVFNINGAAIATSVSYVLGDTLTSLKLYRKYRIHPFYSNYVKVLLIAFSLIAVLKHTLILTEASPGVRKAILGITVYIVLFSILAVVSRCIDKEDLKLLMAIKRKQ